MGNNSAKLSTTLESKVTFRDDSKDVGFEVLILVVKKSSVFWDVTHLVH
jgi:hypothetical protein